MLRTHVMTGPGPPTILHRGRRSRGRVAYAPSMADASSPTGRPPTDLDTRVDVVDGEVRSIHDVIVETYRFLGFDVDAAARVGIDVVTLRRWRRTGAQASRDILEGRRAMSSLSKPERQYVRLNAECAKAEADARTYLIGLAQQVAQGGLEARTVTTETDADGNVLKRTEKLETLAPDGATLRWWLQHRVPELKAIGRIEHTGEDGGPIRLETSDALDRLASLIDGQADEDADAAHAVAGPGSRNGHGNGNGQG